MTSLIFKKYKQSQQANVNKNVNIVNNTLTNSQGGLKTQPPVTPNVLAANVQSPQTQSTNGNTNVIQPVPQPVEIVQGYNPYSLPQVKNDKPTTMKQQQKKRDSIERVAIPRGWIDFYALLTAWTFTGCAEWWLGLRGLTTVEKEQIKPFIALNNLVVPDVNGEEANRAIVLFSDWTLDYLSGLRTGKIPKYLLYFPLVDNYKGYFKDGRIQHGQNPICDEDGTLSSRALGWQMDLRNHDYYVCTSSKSDVSAHGVWDQRRQRTVGQMQNGPETTTDFLDLMLAEKTTTKPCYYNLSKIDFSDTVNNVYDPKLRTGKALPSNVPKIPQSTLSKLQQLNKPLPTVPQNQVSQSLPQISQVNDSNEKVGVQINVTKSDDGIVSDPNYVNGFSTGVFEAKKKLTIVYDDDDDDSISLFNNTKGKEVGSSIVNDINNYQVDEEDVKPRKQRISVFKRIQDNMKKDVKTNIKSSEETYVPNYVKGYTSEPTNNLLPGVTESYDYIKDECDRLKRQNQELMKKVTALDSSFLEKLYKLCTTTKVVELEVKHNIFADIGRKWTGTVLVSQVPPSYETAVGLLKSNSNDGDDDKNDKQKKKPKNNDNVSNNKLPINKNTASNNVTNNNKSNNNNNKVTNDSVNVIDPLNVQSKILPGFKTDDIFGGLGSTLNDTLNSIVKTNPILGPITKDTKIIWADLEEENDVSADPNHLTDFGGEKREPPHPPMQGVETISIDYLEGKDFPHGVGVRNYGRNDITGTPFDDDISKLPTFVWQGDGIVYLKNENEGNLVQGDLAIVPKVDNEGKGPYGELKGYLTSKLEYISIKGIPRGVRVSLNNGTKMMIPQHMIASSATATKREVNKIIVELKDKIKDKTICHSLLATLTNNMWRKNITLDFLKYQDDYINKKPVFGKILEALGDGHVFSYNGHKYIETLPVGGFTPIGDEVILGPFKNGSGKYSKSVIWDVDGREVTKENILEMRKDLQAMYPNAIIQFHAYQSHNTLHVHKFNSLEDYAFFTLCDLWTDRHYSYLRKGFFLDMMEPLNKDTLDLQILAYLFYCLGIRIGDKIYNKGLVSFTDAYKMIKDEIFTSEFFKKVKANVETEKKLYYVTSDHNVYKGCVNKIDFVPAFKDNHKVGNIVYGGGIDLNTLLYKKKDIIVYPSNYALEHDPNPNDYPGYQTHPSLFIDVATGYKPYDKLVCFRTNGCRAYKSMPKRGYAKMVEMMQGIEFKHTDKVFIIGDGQGGFADAICRKVKQDNIHIIDLKFKKEVCDKYKTKVCDFLTIDFSIARNYNFIISDVCASKGADSMKKFLTGYKNIYQSANKGTQFLLKIKGLYDNDRLSELGLWINQMNDLCPTMKIIKPASSRIRNSECYIYFSKVELPNNRGKNLVGMYMTALKENFKTLNTGDHIYNMQSVVTPTKQQTLTDFALTIPNGANVEVITEDPDIFSYFNFAFQYSKMFKNGNLYCFQGKKYELCSIFSIMGGRCLTWDRDDIEDGVADYIGGYKRTLHNKPTCIFNCVKHSLASLRLEGKVLDIGCGKSGIQWSDSKMVSYPTLFSDYEPLDPMHPRPAARFTLDQWLDNHKDSNERYDHALMIQSSHYCIDDKGEKIKELFKHVDTVWYTTWKRSNKNIIGKNGKIFYKNNGTTVTWAGLEQKITPVFGDAYSIPDLGFDVYNRVKTEYYKEILDDVLFIRVNKENFKLKEYTGGSYNSTVNVYHDKVVIPFANDETKNNNNNKDNNNNNSGKTIRGEAQKRLKNFFSTFKK